MLLHVDLTVAEVYYFEHKWHCREKFSSGAEWCHSFGERSRPS